MSTSTRANKYHQKGSYKWFLNKIIPFVSERNPTIQYYYVFINKNRKDFFDARATIQTIHNRLTEFSELLKEPKENLFTDVHIFLSGPTAHSVIINSLFANDYIDLDAESINSNKESRIRRGINVERTSYSGSSTCFDPFEAENIELASQAGTKTIFYILNKKYKIQQAVCLDDDGFDQYFGDAREQPRYSETLLSELESTIETLESEEERTEAREELEHMRQQTITCNSRLFYQCVEASGSLKPIRRLPFAFPIYIMESDSKKIEKRGQYVLYPSSKQLGPILSDCVRLGADMVSSEHCQTNHEDPIYNVRSLPSRVANAPNMGEVLRSMFGSEGGRRRTRRRQGRRTRGQRTIKNL